MDIIILVIGIIILAVRYISEEMPDKHPINNMDLYMQDTLAGKSIEERTRLKKQDRYK